MHVGRRPMPRQHNTSRVRTRSLFQASKPKETMIQPSTYVQCHRPVFGFVVAASLSAAPRLSTSSAVTTARRSVPGLCRTSCCPSRPHYSTRALLQRRNFSKTKQSSILKCNFDTQLFTGTAFGEQSRLRNDLYCVGWGDKLYSLSHSLTLYQFSGPSGKLNFTISNILTLNSPNLISAESLPHTSHSGARWHYGNVLQN